MSEILAKSEADLSISGDAETVFRALQAVSRINVSVTAALAIPVRDTNPRIGRPEMYKLPAIERGEAGPALNRLADLLRQARITSEQFEDIKLRIDDIARLTR